MSVNNCLVVSVQGKLRDGLVDPENRLSPIRHKITAIGFLHMETSMSEKGEVYDLKEWRAGGTAATSEKDLLIGFWHLFDKMKPRLITFNGRGYAMPLLRYSSMAHGLTAKTYHEGDKNYSHRYSPYLHFDVMDQMTETGASIMPSLVDVQNLLGISSLDVPTELSASDEHEYARKTAVYNAGSIALAYLALRLLTNATSLELRDKALEAILEKSKTLFS